MKKCISSNIFEGQISRAMILLFGKNYQLFSDGRATIHLNYLLDAGTLKVIKRSDGFEFTNSGILILAIEDIYHGGNSKPRNPRMQTRLRMIGFGDNASFGFPAILNTRESEGWIEPVLEENTGLNQVVSTLNMLSNLEKGSAEKSAKNLSKL